jgi:hypothetical protein
MPLRQDPHTGNNAASSTLYAVVKNWAEEKRAAFSDLFRLPAVDLKHGDCRGN